MFIKHPITKRLKVYRWLIPFCCFHFYSMDLNAQVDPHFSQYYLQPLWLNPALAGANEGETRVSAIHRNQWSSITNAFTTTGISGDISTNKNINFGLNLIQQTAGDAGYRFQNGQLSISYSGIKLGKAGNHVITMGLQAGFLSRRFDVSKLKGGDQWVPAIGFDPSTISTDVFGRNASTIVDIGAGIAYYDATPQQNMHFFGGFAMSHLNQPEDPFLNTGNKEKLPIRYTLHGGINIIASDAVSIVPNAVVLRQGNATETMVGGYVQMAAGDVTDVLFGLNYRVKDAIYPYVGLYVNNFMVGFSYDINTSSLGTAVKGTSSYELSLVFTGKKKERGSYIKCPRF